MSLPPSEIPQGAIRFNTDSQKLEFYAQGEWWVMSTDTPNLGRGADTTAGARGIIGGGGFNNPAATFRSSIEYVNIASTGGSTNFGDLNVARDYLSATASRTRCVFSGGGVPSATEKTMEFITISSTGTTTNFGEDTADLNKGSAACGNETRGLFGSGFTPSPFLPNNAIQYITISSTGDAKDFGDLRTTSAQRAAFSSSTRGIWAGGYHPGNPDGQLDFVTIASLGAAQDFGDLVEPMVRIGGGSNATRGVYFGGMTTPGGSRTGDINFVTIASTGNATYFGDLVETNREWGRMMPSPTRAIIAGGSPGPYVGTLTSMEQLNFSTQGNAVTFGDLIQGRTFGPGASSNAHGGL